MSIDLRWIDGEDLGTLVNGRLQLARGRTREWFFAEAWPMIERGNPELVLHSDAGPVEAKRLLAYKDRVADPVSDDAIFDALVAYGWKSDGHTISRDSVEGLSEAPALMRPPLEPPPERPPMSLHKDQKRAANEVTAAITARMAEESPAAARDGTMLVRLFLQGPDPLFLMEARPEAFATLCGDLGLSLEDGRSAIEDAHWKGPGSLLLGTGLTDGSGYNLHTMPLEWRREVLWLLLASVTAATCVEAGYAETVSLTERIVIAARTIAGLDYVTRASISFGGLVATAIDALASFTHATRYTVDEKGTAHTDVDVGFYVLYKAGFLSVAVHTKDGPVFYGTTPETTLALQGISVDKEISPCFGLVFPKPKEAPEK